LQERPPDREPFRQHLFKGRLLLIKGHAEAADSVTHAPPANCSTTPAGLGHWR